jgi:hypothetical protein
MFTTFSVCILKPDQTEAGMKMFAWHEQKMDIVNINIIFILEVSFCYLSVCLPGFRIIIIKVKRIVGFYMLFIKYLAEKSSRSDWDSNP